MKVGRFTVKHTAYPHIVDVFITETGVFVQSINKFHSNLRNDERVPKYVSMSARNFMGSAW